MWTSISTTWRWSYWHLWLRRTLSPVCVNTPPKNFGTCKIFNYRLSLYFLSLISSLITMLVPLMNLHLAYQQEINPLRRYTRHNLNPLECFFYSFSQVVWNPCGYVFSRNYLSVACRWTFLTCWMHFFAVKTLLVSPYKPTLHNPLSQATF